MAGEWREVKLGDVAELMTGYPFKSQHYTDDIDAPRLIGGDNIAQGNLRWDSVRRWPRDMIKGLDDYWLESGDVVLAMDRPWIEAGLKRAAVGPHDVPSLLIQRTSRLRGTDELDAAFLRYVVGSQAFTQYILSVQTGTAVPHISPAQIRAFNFLLPPPAEQRAIAHILGTLDDKVELNRRRNQTLEAMARALFKDWFVDFGPVRAKMEGREPYLPDDIWQIFPDRLNDDGKPEGWQCTTLASFASLNPESWTKKNAPHEIRYVDLSNTKQGTIEGAARIPWPEAPSRAQRILRPGDTIVGTVRPGNQSFALIGDEGMTGSTGFAVLRPLEKDFRDFVFLAATSPENIERLTHLADGAAYPAVRPDVVLASPIIVPPGEVAKDVLHGFANTVTGWLDTVEHNKQESQTLAQLRDTLLPKLISGELRIADAEKFMEHMEDLAK